VSINVLTAPTLYPLYFITYTTNPKVFTNYFLDKAAKVFLYKRKIPKLLIIYLCWWLISLMLENATKNWSSQA